MSTQTQTHLNTYMIFFFEKCKVKKVTFMLCILSTILTNKNKEGGAFGAANEGGRLEGIRVDRQKAVDIELG